MEPPLSRMGNPKASRDLGGGPPPEDITRELQKIKLPKFGGGTRGSMVGRHDKVFCLKGLCIQLKGKDRHFLVKGQCPELVG